MIGQTFSHYKVLEKLGEGGMGVVYKAQDTKLLRPVALKFLVPEMTRDQEAKKRFIQEARAASALDHPNIAVVHDIDETEDGHSFICMAYYDGQTLKSRLAKGALNVEEAVRIALQIAGGLQRAHESGIVHRDIKPGNIILTSQGEVKIVDFGLAKLAAQTRETRSQITGGTAAYMAPEQILGHEADAQSDLFSLGVVLYEAATGRRPFIGEHEAALFYSIGNAEPVPPSSIREDVPAELERIILHLLEKDPKKRYQTAADLREDLKHFLGEKPTPRPVRTIRRAMRSRLLIPVVAGTVAVVILGVLLATGVLQQWLTASRVAGPKIIAVIPFNDISADTTKRALCSGLFERVASGLAQLHSLLGESRVLPPSETRAFKKAREARSAFGASLAIEGTFQWSPQEIQVTVDLVNAESLFVIDSRTVRISTDVTSKLEGEVVRSIADMMGKRPRSADLLGLAAGGTKDEKAYAFYLQARGELLQYPKSEKLIAAIGLFQQAIRVDSQYVLAYAGLGEAYWRRYESTKNGQWVDSAVAACTRAVSLNGRLAEVRFTLGIIYRGSGKYEPAIDEFQAILSADSTNADVYRELAEAYRGLGDSARAEASYKKAIEIQPDGWWGYYYLGRCYYSSRRYEDALQMWSRVVKLAPDIRTGYNSVGVVYFTLERWREAKEQFELSLEKDTLNYAAYSNLGTLYYYDQQYERAANMFEKALKLNASNHLVWAGLGAAYRAMGSKKIAQEVYEKATQLAELNSKVNPKDPIPLCNLAGYYVDIGKKAEARALIQRVLAMAPKNIEVLGRIGVVYEQLGDRNTALKFLGEALKKGFSTTGIDYNPEMKGLREDPRYQQLVHSSATQTR